jgi:hypothetical protein
MVVMYTRVSTHECPAPRKNYLTCLRFLPKSADIHEFWGIQGVSSVYAAITELGVTLPLILVGFVVGANCLPATGSSVREASQRWRDRT